MKKKVNSRPTRRAASSHPTETELEILEVLWEHGPCGMGQLHEVYGAKRGSGYTTTQKMIQVMREKGLVTADSTVRPLLYGAAEPQECTRLKLLDYLTQKAFGGSAKELIMSAVSGERLSKEELSEVRSQISKAEKKETER
jgi:BlaI family penicillinase repressor